MIVDNSAIFLPAGRPDLPRDRSIGDISGPSAEEIELGAGIIGSLLQSGRPGFINDTGSDPRAIQIAGTDRSEDEAIDGCAHLWPGKR